MNALCFKLVFSRRVGMLVPVAEHVRAHTASPRARRAPRAIGLIGAAAAALATVTAWAQLPVACNGGACGTNAAPTNFVAYGTAAYSVNGMSGFVQQSTAKAILNWESFNIGRGYSMEFRVPDSTSSTLNRIWQADPSIIAGRLASNGQLYLINQNGILFKDGARVNTAGLIASSLNIRDADYLDGILDPVREATPRPVFTAEGGTAGAIEIEEKAVLETPDGGRILIFAPQVENRGEITAHDGQAILAAGDKVWLMASQDAAVRGLLIEVDAPAGVTATVTNLGTIIAERGNVTLAGLAVNQSGTLKATTALNANGSIRLLARATPVKSPGNDTTTQPIVATRTGNVTFGAGSVTEVGIDANDESTTARAAAFDENGNVLSPSRIEAMGDRIVVESGASIVAPAGKVTLTALKNPSQYREGANQLVSQTPSDSRIYVASGAKIDVSGINTGLEASRNEVTVQLLGNELADSPLQRDGFLRRKTVHVDARVGTPLANVQGAIDNLPIEVKERSTVGGTIALKSEGDVVLAQGSTLDVSGGVVDYAPGMVRSTKLVDSRGRIWDIGSAPADLTYVDFADTYTRTSNRWGVSQTYYATPGTYTPGYVKGASAGTIELAGSAIAAEGTLRANVVRGPYQRSPADLPLGGRLIVGDITQDLGGFNPFLRAPDILIAGSLTPRAGGANDPLPPGPLVLSERLAADGGFSRFDLYSDGEVRVDASADVTVAPGGVVRLVGEKVDVQGQINAPSGTIDLRSVRGDTTADNDITVGPNAQLAARGNWVNDSPLLPRGEILPPTAINGGKISVRAAEDVDIAAGSRLDVSGGAWLKSSGALARGDGGSIEAAVQQTSSTQLRNPDGTLALNGELIGHAPGRGGSLRLVANAIKVGDGNASAPGELALGNDFFTRGGFNSFDLVANKGDLRVTSNARIDLAASSLVLDPRAGSRPSGANLLSFSTPTVLPLDKRTPVAVTDRLKLTVNPTAAPTYEQAGVLMVESGASIRTDPRGRVALEAPTRLAIDGNIETPAGEIRVTLGSLPGSIQDPGFRPEQSIWLGANARLAAPGAAIRSSQPSTHVSGEVLAGGRVALNAGRGHVVAERGARIDVSGAADTLDIRNGNGQPIATRIASAAGSVAIAAPEGLLLDGAITGQPGGSGVAGSTLSLELKSNSSIIGSPAAPRTLTVAAAQSVTVPAGLQPGQPIPAALNGTAKVVTDRYTANGFDALELKSADRIVIETPTGARTITAGRSLQLDAPTIALSGTGDATLAAPYVALANTNTSVRGAAPTLHAGNGALTVKAQVAEVIGHVVADEIARLNFRVDHDLRLRGLAANVSAPTALTGSLDTAAPIDFRAAQIYPATLTDFTVQASGPNDTITLSAGGAAPAPLSAGGRLTFKAADIVQAGVVRAPLGEISYEAADSLTLAPGSITSVSAEGTVIPFGTVQNGADWFYAVKNLADVVRPGKAEIGDITLREKHVALKGPRIDVQSGAVIDVSGGGDLHAWEFVAGPGGTVDVLANENAVKGGTESYAVLPWLRSGGAAGDLLAPYDHQSYTGSTLRPGDAIELAGGAGLPGGRYALLPARYALLPGAYLVTSTAKYADLPAAQRIDVPGGGQIVSGRRVSAGTELGDARTSGYIVTPGSVARQRAEYRDYYASDFFAAQARAAGESAPRLPVDAGRLSAQVTVAATASTAPPFRFEGIFKGAPGKSDARGAQVDIAAANIAIVNSLGQTSGMVELDASKLSSLGAESIVIGATRSRLAGGEALAVEAQTVVMEGGARLSAPEVVLAATDRVELKSGASVEAVGTNLVPATSYIVGEGGNGDAAIVRASTGAQAPIERRNSTGTTGDIVLAPGAHVEAGGSIAFDASRDTGIAGAFDAHGGSLRLGARRISLGETAGQGISEGVVFDNATIAARFAGLKEVVLASAGAIDLYGTTTLDGLGLESLRLETGTLAGHANAGKTASLGARNIAIGNPNGKTGTSGSGNGTLAVNAAEDLLFTKGDLGVSGFARTELRAGRQISGEGAGEVKIAGDAELVAPVVTGAAASDRKINATGALEVKPNGMAQSTRPADLAAKLELAGRTVAVSGLIDLPAGQISLLATGAGPGDNVTIQAGGVVRASGVEKDFFGEKANAPAGTVALEANGGDVATDVTSLIDVSAAGTGDAGRLVVKAQNGTFTPQGDMRAQGAGGEFAADVGRVDDFAALAAKLGAAEFDDAIGVHARTGNVTVAASDQLKARQIALTADAGALSVGGKLDASGEKGGRIELQARDALTLASSALLDASATGAGNDGGKVLLGTTQGTIDAAAGSTIDVAGGAGGRGGKVQLRAPRVGSTDIAISRFDATTQSASSVVAEGNAKYNGVSSITSTQTAMSGSWFADTQAFMANAAAIKNRLGRAGDATFVVAPGLEIQSSGNMTLANDWSLHAWRFDPATGVPVTDVAQLRSGVNAAGEALVAGALTLRAAGNLDFNASLSDGFEGAGVTSRINDGGASWSYRLVAGADAGSADVMRTIKDAGDMTIAGGTRPASPVGAAPTSIRAIRTGTGDIDIAAGRDLKLTNAQSMIYTAGHAVQRRSGNANVVNSAVYADHGGDIRIRSGRDIVGAKGDQLITGWLHREGRAATATTAATPASWWIDYRYFQQNVGALGGGDATVQVGGSITNLSVVSATSLRPGATTPIGGGGVRVEAGGDIRGGVFMVGHGEGSLRAGGVIGKTAPAAGIPFPLNPVLAIGQGAFDARARGDLTIETALNPTVVPQGVEQGGTTSYAFTYGAGDHLNLTSLAGDVALSNDIQALTHSSNFARNVSVGTQLNQASQAFTVYPPALRVQALQGGIELKGAGPILFPSPQGDLKLLAERDIVSTETTAVNLSDADRTRLPSIAAPNAAYAGEAARFPLDANSLLYNRAPTPVHQGDTTQAKIISRAGDIIDGKYYLNKRSEVIAGGDIVDARIEIQHADRGSVSRIIAGDDITFNAERDAATNAFLDNTRKLSIAGPGTLEIRSGGDINLGSSTGILSIGNLENASLPAGGANVLVYAGVPDEPATAAFVNAVLPKYLAIDSAQLRELVFSMLVAQQDPGLRPFYDPKAPNENFKGAAFDAYLLAKQQELLPKLQADPVAYRNELFFTELKLAGRTGDLAVGRTAGTTLFPGKDYDGDIELVFSQIKTRAGGDVDIFVPGGGINAGLATPPAELKDTKQPDDLGIVAQDMGRVRVFARDDITVNQSRIFALRGGDITLWAPDAGIDAGRGAKTAISAPPPVLQIDNNGNVSFIPQGAAVGSGIRIILTIPGDVPGNVDLVAREVNTGDAGIGSAGNLFLRAERVIGADNFQVAGVSTGVPSLTPAPVTTGAEANTVAEASKTSEQVAQTAAAAAQTGQSLQETFRPTFITWEVTGFGD